MVTASPTSVVAGSAWLAVTWKAHPGKEEEVVRVFSILQAESRKEPGCLMFNITTDNADPNILYLFEVYKDDKAVEAHKKMLHFLKWLETTKNWLAAPLEIMPATTIYPPADSWKKRPAPKK